MRLSLPRISPFSLIVIAALATFAQPNASAAVTVSIQVNEPTIFEGDATAIRITRVSDATDDAGYFADIDVPLNVNLSIAGTARNGVDYEQVTSPVQIPAGASAVDFVFQANSDSITEPTAGETAKFTIASSPNYQIATANEVVVTVVEQRDLPIVSITQTQTVIDEDSADPAVFTFRRTGLTDEELTVPLAISGTGVNGVDYDSIQSSITFGVGESAVEIGIQPVDDTRTEGSEIVRVGLQPNNPINTTYVVSEGSPRAVLEIRDNDIPPVLSILRGSSDALEGTGGPQLGGTGVIPIINYNLNFLIRRTGSLQNSLRVNIALTGSATEGGDFAPLSSFYIIPAGQESVLVQSYPYDDSIVEGAETVIVSAKNDSSEYSVSPSNGSATVNILDNEEATSIQISALSPQGSEAGAPIVFRVTRSSGNRVDNSQPLTFNYSVSGSAATADYNTLSGVGTIPSGSSFTTITVQPISDNLEEPDESLTISLDSLPHAPYLVGANASATGTIADFVTTPTISLAGNVLSVVEPRSGRVSNRGIVTISRTGSATSSLNVYYNIRGTAKNGRDYRYLNGVVTIPAGQVSTPLYIVPLADNVKERQETLTLSLRLAAGYNARTNSATVRIRDSN